MPDRKNLENRGVVQRQERLGGLLNYTIARQLERGRHCMVTINRCAIIVQPGQLFLDWLRRVDPSSAHLSLEDLRLEPTIYLLAECENREEAIERLSEVCTEIFEEQLDGWYRVPLSWPSERGLNAFLRWFEWTIHSMIVDLDDSPIEHEEI